MGDLMRMSACVCGVWIVLICVSSSTAWAADTDGDGLSDEYESSTLGTNPGLADTDGSGVPDGYEVLQGKDPSMGGDDDPLASTLGEGHSASWARATSSLSGLAGADSALDAPSLSYRLDAPIDYSDGGAGAGAFSENALLEGVFGADPSDVAARVTGWVAVAPAPAGATENVRTFAVGADQGWRLRVWDGASTASASAEQLTGFTSRVAAEVAFPNEGGLFPFELTYYEGTQVAGLELSWASGRVATFDPAVFALVPAASMAAADLSATQTAADADGGDLLVGDTLTVSLTLTNLGDAPAFGVRVRPELIGADFGSFSMTPAGSSIDPMNADTLVVPVLDPGVSLDVTYEVTVTAALGQLVSVQASLRGDVSTVGVGDGALSASSDDPTQLGATVAANAPFSLTTAAGSDDDPNLALVGSSAPDPTMTATSPALGQRYLVDSMTFGGTSTGADSAAVLLYDEVGASQLFLGILDAGLGTWSASIGPLEDGDYTAVLHVTDARGFESSVLRTFTVNVDPPPLSLLTPSPGEFIAQASPTVAGTTAPGQVVSLTLDGGALPDVTADAQGFWSVVIQGPLSEAAHVLSVAVVDGDGLTSHRDVTFTVDLSTAVSLTLPASPGTLTSQTRPTIEGSAEQGASVTVSFSLAGAIVETLQVFGVPASGAWSVTPASDLADGAYTLEVSARDIAGNIATDSTTLTIDSQPPSLTFGSPADGSTISELSPELAGSTGPDARVFVSIDGAPEVEAAVAANGRWSLTPSAPLSAGPHTVTARAEDPAGNGSATLSSSFTIDASGPGAGFTTPLDGDSLDSATFDIAGTSEPFALVTVSVDGVPLPGVFVDGAGIWSISPGPALTEGSHVLSARAQDGVGNSGPASSITIDVDLTNPTVSISSPSSGDVLADATPLFVGQAEPNATVEVRVDNTKISDTPVDAQGDWSFQLPGTVALGDGAHGVSARATDRSGRRSLFAAVSFSVDTQPPASTITSPADGEDVLSDVLVRGSASEPGSTIVLVLDPGPSEVALAPLTTDALGAWSATLNDLTPGPHILEARATDPAGNTGASAPISIRVADDPLSLEAPLEGDVLSDATPIFRGAALAGASLEVTVDAGAARQVIADTQGRWSLASTTLTQGAHVVTVRSGVLSLERSFSVDTTAPGLLFEEPSDGLRVGSATPTLSGVTTPDRAVEVFVGGVYLGEVTADALGVWRLTASPLSEGPHSATARVCDLADNCAQDATSFFVDLTPPSLAFTRPGDDETLSDPTPLVRGTSEPRARLELELDGVVVSTSDVADDGSWSYQILSPQTAGAHTLTATSTDAAGNASSATRAFTLDSSLPSISLDLPRDGGAVPVTRPTFAGSANPGAVVDLTIDGAPAGTATADAGGEWSLLAPSDLAVGTHSATATFDNGAVAVSQSSTFDVDLSAPGIQWTSPADGSSTADPTPSLTASTEPRAAVLVTLPDGGTVALVTDVSGDVAFDVPAILPDGPHTFSILASDAAGNRSAGAPLEVVVDTRSEISILSPDADAILPVGDLDVVGRAEPGADLTATLDGAPAGVAVAAADGSFTLTLSGLTAGAHLLSISSTDPLGNVGVSEVDFISDERAPALAILAPEDGATLDTDLVTFRVTSNPGQEISLALDGAALADLTADASGDASLETPIEDALAEGDHVLVARAEGADGISTEVRVSFTVDLPDAVLTVDSPAPNTTVTTSTPTIQGTADPGVDVTLDIDGERVADLVADDNGLWRHVIPEGDELGDGPHLLFVSSSLGARVGPFSFTVDATTVSISFTAPRSGEALSDTTPTFAGTADPEAFVEIFVDDAPAGDTFADLEGVWSITLDDPLDDGVYSAEAVARVGLKGASTGARPFEIDTTPPDLAITQPSVGEQTQNAPFLVGTSEPGASVALSVDGVLYETARTNANGDWRVKVSTDDPLTPGDRVLTAVATDDVGNASAPAEVRFIVLAPEGAGGGGAASSDEGCCATAPVAPRRAPSLALAFLALLALLVRSNRRDRCHS